MGLPRSVNLFALACMSQVFNMVVLLLAFVHIMFMIFRSFKGFLHVLLAG